MTNKSSSSGPITLRTPLGEPVAASKPQGEDSPPVVPSPAAPPPKAIPVAEFISSRPAISPTPIPRSGVLAPPSSPASAPAPRSGAGPITTGPRGALGASVFGAPSAPKAPPPAPSRPMAPISSSSPGGGPPRSSSSYGGYGGSGGAFGSSGSGSSSGGGPGGGGLGGGGDGGGPFSDRSPSAKEVLRILSRYLSQILARQMLDRAAQQIGRPQAQLVAADMPRLVDVIERDARTFLDSNNVNRLRAELTALLPESARVRGPLNLEIRIESDIAQARMLTREICESLGGNRLKVQQAATIVSELTRNMVSYAGGGKIELIPKPRPSAAIVIKASDHGPGIKNLPEILGGHYRSRSGLGLGILGAKRLSDHFEIESNPSGTRITVEVRL